MTTPRTIAELLARLDHMSAKMPKRLQQCAVHLRANINTVAVTTVADMSSAAGIAPSAFMRFCKALGFTGYSEMQALFRSEYDQIRPTYSERLSDLSARGENSSARLLVEFSEAGHKSLVSLLNITDMHNISLVVDRLAQARTIHLVGMRRAFAVVSHMGYMLQEMGIPCVLHNGAAGMEFSSAIQFGDLVFAVTFAPFSPETCSFAEAAQRLGAPLLLLTDSADCPLGKISETQLIAREVDVGAFRVPTASMTLVTAIAVALGAARGA